MARVIKEMDLVVIDRSYPLARYRHISKDRRGAALEVKPHEQIAVLPHIILDLVRAAEINPVVQTDHRLGSVKIIVPD